MCKVKGGAINLNEKRVRGRIFVHGKRRCMTSFKENMTREVGQYVIMHGKKKNNREYLCEVREKNLIIYNLCDNTNTLYVFLIPSIGLDYESHVYLFSPSLARL